MAKPSKKWEVFAVIAFLLCQSKNIQIINFRSANSPTGISTWIIAWRSILIKTITFTRSVKQSIFYSSKPMIQKAYQMMFSQFKFQNSISLGHLQSVINSNSITIFDLTVTKLRRLKSTDQVLVNLKQIQFKCQN